VMLPKEPRYCFLPTKGSKFVSMAHFFSPRDSAASDALKGLVTCTKHVYKEIGGKQVQMLHTWTAPMETEAGPTAGGFSMMHRFYPKNYIY